MQIQKIPKTFTSLEHYFGSFTTPLLEETHADLRSGLEAFSRATPHAELESIEVATQDIYSIKIKAPKVANIDDDDDDDVGKGCYKPLEADIFVLTRSKPRHVSDLTRNAASYIMGYVVRSSDYDEKLDSNQYTVKLSRKLEIKSYRDTYFKWETKSNRETYFIVFLLNMTTSVRIWKSLDLELAKSRNLSIINKLLTYDSSVSYRTSLLLSDIIMIIVIHTIQLLCIYISNTLIFTNISIFLCIKR